MVGILAFLLLLLVFLAPLLLGRDKRMLLGINLYATINAILIVPGILALSGNPELLHPDIYMSVPIDTAAFAWTIAMIALLNLGVYLAYFVGGGHRAVPAGAAPRIRLQPYETPIAIALLIALAFAIFLQKLAAFGGLGALSDTVQDRVALQAGFGPANFLASAAAVLATILAARRALLLRTPTAYALLAGVALACAVMFSLFGGRKDSIQLAAMALAVIAFYRPQFMLLGLKTLLVLAGAYAAMFVYFVVVFIYRNWTGDLSVTALAEQVVEAFDTYQQFLVLLSYSDTYLFVTNFFDAGTYYLGSTFHDLLTAFVPSGVMPDKPPVDDGMFVRAATAGYILQPGTPAYLISHNSFPPETLGTAYMNGGPWLVLPFGLLLGAVFARVSGLIARHPNSPFVLAIYLNVFLNFEISNLRITQLIAQVAFTALLIGALRLLFGRRPAPQPQLLLASA